MSAIRQRLSCYHKFQLKLTWVTKFSSTVSSVFYGFLWFFMVFQVIKLKKLKCPITDVAHTTIMM